MLDCNSLTLAITDLQHWVLGQDLISDMRISILMKDVWSKHNEEALNIALVVLEPKCALNVYSKQFGSLMCIPNTLSPQRVHVEIDVVHLR